MAFLKSSQLSLGPKTVDAKGFTQAGTLKLGDRAYTEHEVLLADNYNIVGDVTVSDNLILSKLSDDGNAINITGDTTTRTITGSGSIEGATLAQTPNATLTGMTGELGSAVNLGSATFPAGHVVQTSPLATTTTAASLSSSWDNIGLQQTITPSSSSSKILILCQIAVQQYRAAVETFAGIGLQRNGTDIWMKTQYESVMEAGMSGSSRTFLSSNNPIVYVDSPSSTSAITYRVLGKAAAGTATFQTNGTASSMLLMEIKG